MNDYVSKEMLSWKARLLGINNSIDATQMGIRQLQLRLKELEQLKQHHLEIKPER